jgi:hypothetical protein
MHLWPFGFVAQLLIAFRLSICFIVNQIYGPGVLAIPLVYQQSGYVLTLIALTFFFIMSCLSSTMLIQVMSMIPGNDKFQKRFVQQRSLLCVNLCGFV